MASTTSTAADQDKPRSTRRRAKARPAKSQEVTEADMDFSIEPSEAEPPKRRRRKAETGDKEQATEKKAKKEKPAEKLEAAPVEAESRPSSVSDEVGEVRSEGGSDDSDSSTGNRRRRRRRRRRSGGTGGSPTPNGGGGGGGGGGKSGGEQGGGKRRNRQNNRNRSRSRNTRTATTNGADIQGEIEGVLEMHPKGYGFLRDPKKNYAAQDSDAFVSSSVIEKHRLREGILIRGEVGPGTKGQGPRLKSIETIDGRTVEAYQEIKSFEDLTAINPFEQIKLEVGTTPITMRVMDLLTPIGKGQRALIVAPPRTGKTMLLQEIADSVSRNHPEVHVMVLLIDERPEEVTEMTRKVQGEVIASSMDREVESHIRISQLIIERAKRLAEAGQDVFILLDSITRTARAFNKWTGNTGRTMSGGLDVKALDIPKKMFGTARRFDEGGSLTVVATALIDTGSRMDEVIFQEFKGTGNMELVLSRDLADRRIWPAIDVTRSGTRREEKILSEEVMEGVTMLRRSLISLSPVEAMEQLTKTLLRFESNTEFLAKIRSIL